MSRSAPAEQENDVSFLEKLSAIIVDKRNLIFLVVIILLILRIGHIMDVGFEQVFLMMNGAVSDVADVFDTYVYRLGIKQGQLSFSTAVGVFKSIVGLILVIGANKLAKKFGEDGVY